MVADRNDRDVQVVIQRSRALKATFIGQALGQFPFLSFATTIIVTSLVMHVCTEPCTCSRARGIIICLSYLVNAIE